MNVVVVHRIPFAKMLYDLALDHREHTVRYLSPADAFDDLPADVQRRVLDVPTSETRAVAERNADWLSQADRLIARSEYDLLPAARLRADFGIPGDLPAAVLPVRDKWVMRTLAGQAGIAQPRCWNIDDFLLDPPRDGRYLIKPRMEASTSGIEAGDVAQILNRIAQGGYPPGTFVEEFVPGEIWHLDGYLRDGEIGAVVSSVYVGNCLGFAQGSPLGSAQTPDAPEALSLLRSTLAALGQRNGSFHFECIRAPDGRFLFLETAARVGGAGVAETFELRTGINLYQVDLQYQLWGFVEEVPKERSRHYYGWFVFPAHHCVEHATFGFDSARFDGRLRSFVHNPHPASHPGQISYATAATPLSGVVQGTAAEVRLTLPEIFAHTRIMERG